MSAASPGRNRCFRFVGVFFLAGVPAPVVVRAREVLDRLESKDQSPTKLDDLPLFAVSQAVAVTSGPARAAPSAVETSLADLDVDGMSPREALEALYRLKGLLTA